MQSIFLSLIAPAHNEEPNVPGLVEDVRVGLEGADISFELIIVDDASTDRTRELIARVANLYPWVRGLALPSREDGKGHGQSAAFLAGIREARGSLVAFLDADRQNEPGDLIGMLRIMQDQGADMVQGDRSANRRDGRFKRISSWIGRAARRKLLRDPIRDTGCSLRVLRREIALALPLQYRGMHRFIPYYAAVMGHRVIEMQVRHRARVAGSSKYGPFERALPGLRDVFAVRWMRSRLRSVVATPILPSRSQAEEDGGHAGQPES